METKGKEVISGQRKKGLRHTYCCNSSEELKTDILAFRPDKAAHLLKKIRTSEGSKGKARFLGGFPVFEKEGFEGLTSKRLW